MSGLRYDVRTLGLTLFLTTSGHQRSPAETQGQPENETGLAVDDLYINEVRED